MAYVVMFCFFFLGYNHYDTIRISLFDLFQGCFLIQPLLSLLRFLSEEEEFEYVCLQTQAKTLSNFAFRNC